MINLILKAIWLMLPAAAANMAPVLFKRVPLLSYPVDFNKKLNGKPLFGSHKTYRGFLFGILAAIFVVYLQRFFYDQTVSFSLVDYSRANILLIGFLLGFGALFGDLIKSFLKRRRGVASGKSWMPYDQIDWIVGALLFISFYVSLSWELVLICLFFLGFLHPVMNLLGYYLGIKKNKL